MYRNDTCCMNGLPTQRANEAHELAAWTESQLYHKALKHLQETPALHADAMHLLRNSTRTMLCMQHSLNHWVRSHAMIGYSMCSECTVHLRRPPA